MIPLIILTWNKPTITKDSIDSLEKFTDPKILDIIICDNNSSQPGMSEYLLELEKKYKVIYNKHNLIHQGWFPGIRFAMEKYPGLKDFMISDPDIVLSEKIPKNWPILLLNFLERHEEVAKVGVLLDFESTQDTDIITYYHRINYGTYPTDVFPDPCYRMAISTTLSMLRVDTFEDLFTSRINDHKYNKKYKEIISVGGRFTCKHLGWEMYKDKYREDFDFIKVQDTRTFMTSIRHLLGQRSFFNPSGTSFYKVVDKNA